MAARANGPQKVSSADCSVRRTVNGILWVPRTGSPWRDLPERHGLWSSVADTFCRWRAVGVWDRVLAELQREADARGALDWTLHHVDSTVVRAHRHAAGAHRTGAVGG